jgi:phosphatidylserine/phosphatidylglycerophosphate/cardiolipin synthase-like enzyme
VSVQSNANQYVQVLRTTPQMNFSTTGPDTLPGSSFLRWMLTTYSEFKRPPLSFAKDGIFEFKVALKKAISQAERYIFIADQAFSGIEIMDWINARIKQKPDLKVILLHGADPADPPSGFLYEAINKHLVADIKPVFEDFDFAVPNIAFYVWNQTVVHSKVTIIDDKWCAIGSANCMRRSLYTDMELSISILDSVAPSFVKKFRRDLWLRYCGILPKDKAATVLFDLEEDKRKEFLDLDIALGIWNSKWANQQPSVKLLQKIQTKVVPFTEAPTIAFNQEKYDLEDADSRMKF